MAKTFKRDNERSMGEALRAWLTFIKFWADSIRVLPKTHTIVFDDFDRHSIRRLGEFIEFDLDAGHVLLDPREHPDYARRHVKPPSWDTFGGRTRFTSLRSFAVQDGKLAGFNPDKSKSVPGVRAVVPVGAGMGLVNMKRCVDEIKLESTVGKGTKLVMRIFITDQTVGSGRDGQNDEPSTDH